MSPIEAVLRFVEVINAGKPDGIGDLLTEEHQFIDPGGLVVDGRETTLEAWRKFLQVVPDYRI